MGRKARDLLGCLALPSERKTRTRAPFVTEPRKGVAPLPRNPGRAYRAPSDRPKGAALLRPTDRAGATMSTLEPGSYVTHAKLPELGSGEVIVAEKGTIRIRFA